LLLDELDVELAMEDELALELTTLLMDDETDIDDELLLTLIDELLLTLIDELLLMPTEELEETD